MTRWEWRFQAGALLRFAEEETKHQELFRRSMARFNQAFGVECGADVRRAR